MKYKKVILISVVAVIVIVALFFALRSINAPDDNITPLDTNAVIWDGNKQLPIVDGVESISIPGFDNLTFIANQTHQRVNFYNPEINGCLFVMTLFVGDKQLWQSGNVAPGSGFYEIDISEPLSAGMYQGNLKIKCVAGNGDNLNSASIKFNLIVKDGQ